MGIEKEKTKRKDGDWKRGEGGVFLTWFWLSTIFLLCDDVLYTFDSYGSMAWTH